MGARYWVKKGGHVSNPVIYISMSLISKRNNIAEELVDRLRLTSSVAHASSSGDAGSTTVSSITSRMITRE